MRERAVAVGRSGRSGRSGESSPSAVSGPPGVSTPPGESSPSAVSIPWSLVRPVLGALLRRPDLWPAAVVVAVRTAPNGWWRRWPPVPRPDPDYLRFRMVTNYGGDGTRPPDPDDLLRYLEWCRRAGRRRG